MWSNSSVNLALLAILRCIIIQLDLLGFLIFHAINLENTSKVSCKKGPNWDGIIGKRQTIISRALIRLGACTSFYKSKCIINDSTKHSCSLKLIIIFKNILIRQMQNINLIGLFLKSETATISKEAIYLDK